MWFFPTTRGLEPSVEQKKVEKAERTNKFLPIVSNSYHGALRIVSDAAVFSCFLEAGKKVNHKLEPGRGATSTCWRAEVNSIQIPNLGAVKIMEEEKLLVEAKKDAELLLVDVLL